MVSSLERGASAWTIKICRADPGVSETGGGKGV
jgi:hypothetical protein